MSSFEYIYGVHSIEAALKAKKRKFLELYMLETSKGFGSIKKTASERNIKVVNVKRETLSKLTSTKKHQGIAAKVTPLPLLEIGEVFNVGFSEKPFLVILDSLEDPRNLGAIARSALCLGVDAIVIPKNRSVGPTPVASKVSAGALEHIPVICETNITRVIEELKANGYWTAGLAAEGETDLENIKVSAPFALIVGSEGKGIRPLVRKKCDFLMKIDQTGPVSSLNAGVAAAIAIYECSKEIKKNIK